MLNEYERNKKITDHLRKRYRDIYSPFLEKFRELSNQIHTFQYSAEGNVQITKSSVAIVF